MTRVAITTDRFHDVAGAFESTGLVPVRLPCIRVRPAGPTRLKAARAAASDAEFLVITSPRVVALLWPYGGMPDVDTAAVGAATATAVTAAGGRVAVTGDGGLDRLVDVAAHLLDGRRVMLAHAAGSDPLGMSRLRRTNADLSDWVVYESVPVGPAMTPVDAVAFASPSAVAGWALTRDLDEVVAGVIGPTTARAVGRHRLPDVIAETPSYPALAEAIAAHMEVRL